MKRINLPLVLDTIFAAMCAFFLFFTVVRYYTRSIPAAISVAIVACIAFGLISFLRISKKRNKKLLISHDEKNKKLLALHLSLSAENDVKSLLSKCLAESDANTEIKSNRIIVGEVAYFFNFKMQPLNEDDVAKVIKVGCKQKKIILCNAVCSEAKLLCEGFLIEVKDIDDIYDLLKENQLLPEKYVYEGKNKVNVFKKIKARFTRKICLPLFLSGLAMLALSYFTFFPLYYIISGGIMLSLSAVSLVFG